MSARRLASSRVVISSRNRGKIREFAQLLEPHAITILTAEQCGLQPVEETGRTFAENAGLKARAAAGIAGMPAISDDSGLEVEALDGQPGIDTANWAETPQGRNYVVAMTRVWKLLEELGAPHPRRARFHSTICVAWPDGHEDYFTGNANGHLVWPMRGETGFGFDPMFVPEGHTSTFGEMPHSLKNSISHRARALAALSRACLDG